jgi:hypothetical protein
MTTKPNEQPKPITGLPLLISWLEEIKDGHDPLEIRAGFRPRNNYMPLKFVPLIHTFQNSTLGVGGVLKLLKEL